MMSTNRILTQFTFLLIITFLAGSLISAEAALAQEQPPTGPTDDQVNTIAKQLYCPVCENIPLDVCPTQACAQWRDLIREKLGEGWTENEIKDYFVAQYGDRVLASPPAKGLNWLVYIIPPLAIIGGVLVLYRVLRAWRQEPPVIEGGAQSGAEIDNQYVSRIEDELRNR